MYNIINIFYVWIITISNNNNNNNNNLVLTIKTKMVNPIIGTWMF